MFLCFPYNRHIKRTQPKVPNRSWLGDGTRSERNDEEKRKHEKQCTKNGVPSNFEADTDKPAINTSWNLRLADHARQVTLQTDAHVTNTVTEQTIWVHEMAFWSSNHDLELHRERRGRRACAWRSHTCTLRPPCLSCMHVLSRRSERARCVQGVGAGSRWGWSRNQEQTKIDQMCKRRRQ